MEDKNIHIENMGNTDLKRAFFLPATSLILYNRHLETTKTFEIFIYFMCMT